MIEIGASISLEVSEVGKLPLLKFTSTAIHDVEIITPVRHQDARGFFSETWSRRALSDNGLAADFVQDNLAHSKKAGTVRGLHYQDPPMAQGKLVSVLSGAVFDVALDIRAGSPSYGQHVSATLSAGEGNQIWIPAGFAHGYCSLEDDTLLFYKQTAFYAPDQEGGILWNDPALGIEWPVRSDAAILSDKDLALPTFAEWEQQE